MAEKKETPSQRAAKAEKSAKAARSQVKSLKNRANELAAKARGAATRARQALASPPAAKIGKAAAGGFLGGAAVELVSHYAAQGTFGDTMTEYLVDDRFTGSGVAVLGALGVVMAERSKSKHRHVIADVAAGVVAGGAACAARPIVRGLLPAAVAPAAPPREARGLRYDYNVRYERAFDVPSRRVAPRRVEALRLEAPPMRAPAFDFGNRRQGVLR